jgi:predicted permease
MPNLRLALRTLFKTPFVTLVAVLSLALGIGANTAIFSLFDQVLFRSLPVSEPHQLVNLSSPGPKPGSTSCNQAGDCDAVFSYAMFRDLEREATALTGIAAHCLFGANLAYKGQTLNGDGVLVSGSYFPVLGLRPALGRLLSPDDDQVIGEAHVAVLSYEYWQSRFGLSPDVLKETMVVNGQTLQIVGVAPRGFEGTTTGTAPRVFVPITLRGLLQPPFKGFDDRRAYWAYLFGRLKPGVTIGAAKAALNVPYRAVLNDVEAPLQKGMSEKTLSRFKAKEIGVEPGARGQSDVRREAGTALILLFSVTGVVLIIACANIANLLLARSAARAGEMAVRLSIGASRQRLIAQLLAESCLLALMGGTAGLMTAKGTLLFIGSLLPADAPRTMFDMNAPVLLFALLLSLGTGVVFGLFPAFHSTRPDLVSTLKGLSGQPSGTRGAAWFRTVLVTIQITLSMALLGCAGLFIKSLANVSRVDLGLKIDHLVTFGLSPRMNGYNPERSLALFERVESEFSGVPGVTGVTASLVPLVGGSSWGSNVVVQGFEAGPDTDTNSRFSEVGPGFFSTLGIPLLAGREFTRADGLSAPKVAVVNETFAKKFNLAGEAVGKRMRRGGGKDLDIEIVGLVKDVKYNSVKGEVPPIFYFPYRQDDQLGQISFYIRTGLAPEQFLQTIPKIVARLDPNLPVESLRTMPQQIQENVFLDRMISTLAASFAALATLLAAVGLYGVLAYAVTQRTREFGLRMALGADPRRVLGIILRQVGWMTLAGGGTGVAIALAAGHYAETLLFQMRGYDPVVMASSATVMGVVALLAGLIPAIRASRIEPMHALRYE